MTGRVMSVLNMSWGLRPEDLAHRPFDIPNLEGLSILLLCSGSFPPIMKATISACLAVPIYSSPDMAYCPAGGDRGPTHSMEGRPDE